MIRMFYRRLTSPGRLVAKLQSQHRPGPSPLAGFEVTTIGRF